MLRPILKTSWLNTLICKLMFYLQWQMRLHPLPFRHISRRPDPAQANHICLTNRWDWDDCTEDRRRKQPKCLPRVYCWTRSLNRFKKKNWTVYNLLNTTALKRKLRRKIKLLLRRKMKSKKSINSRLIWIWERHRQILIKTCSCRSWTKEQTAVVGRKECPSFPTRL